MSEVKTIAKNTAVLTVAQAVQLGTGLVLLVYMARLLGDTGYGKLSFAQSLTGLFMILANLGLDEITIMDIARRKELASKYLGNVITLRIMLAAITMLMIILTINLMDYPSDTTMAVYIFGGSVVLDSCALSVASIFRAFERMEYVALLDIMKSVMITVIGLILLFSGQGLIAVSLVYLLGSTFGFISSMAFISAKVIKPRLAADIRLWRQLVPKAMPFALAKVVGVIYLQIDVVMLSLMKGDAAVGWYRAAVVLVLATLVIPEIFSSAIFPVMARFHKSSSEIVMIITQKAAKYQFALGVPVAVGTIILADRIIEIIYGAEFSNSTVALQILSLYLPLRFLNHSLGGTLSATDKQVLRMVSLLIGAVANVVLNLLLIPPFSYKGAAMATAITEVLLFASYYYFVAKSVGRLRFTSILIKPCLAVVIMAVPVLLLKNVSLPLAVISGGAVYFIGLYAVRWLDIEDKAILRDLAGSKLGFLAARQRRD